MEGVYIVMIIALLAALSLMQRLLPWLLMPRLHEKKGAQELFNLFAVSAFATLAVYNVTVLSLSSILSLTVAVIVAVKTRNLGYAVLCAIAISLVSSYLL